MGQVRKPGNRRNTAPVQPSAGPAAEGPACLARTQVYRKVPVAVRSRLDQVILLRPEDCPTLEAVAEKFKLAQGYGVSAASLRTYARKLEQVVRPAVTSHLMAGVLGCLPERYRQHLVAGGQVLLLSRVVQALSGEGESALSVADLAKLASILSAVAGRPATRRRESERSRRGRRPQANGEQALIPGANPAKMAEAVRMLYGLSWPPGDQEGSGSSRGNQAGSSGTQ